MRRYSDDQADILNEEPQISPITLGPPAFPSSYPQVVTTPMAIDSSNPLQSNISPRLQGEYGTRLQPSNSGVNRTSRRNHHPGPYDRSSRPTIRPAPGSYEVSDAHTRDQSSAAIVQQCHEQCLERADQDLRTFEHHGGFEVRGRDSSHDLRVTVERYVTFPKKLSIPEEWAAQMISQ